MSNIPLQEIEHYLDTFFLSRDVVDYCPNGLQVEGKPFVKKMATAVSANVETITIAVSKEIDVLIVHHGLFWQKGSEVIRGTKKEKIFALLKNGISLFAYHLPLDMHVEVGNNWRAAQELHWFDLQPFMIKGIPLGVIGSVKPCSREEFQKQLEAYYQHSAMCSFGGNKQIQSAALISGGAHKSLIDAAKLGIDAFVTGSFDEPSWYEAQEEQINFYALGHAATERVGPMALAEHLRGKFSCSCEFIDVVNPF